jgi:hypothetical protein
MRHTASSFKIKNKLHKKVYGLSNLENAPIEEMASPYYELQM